MSEPTEGELTLDHAQYLEAHAVHRDVTTNADVHDAADRIADAIGSVAVLLGDPQ